MPRERRAKIALRRLTSAVQQDGPGWAGPDRLPRHSSVATPKRGVSNPRSTRSVCHQSTPRSHCRPSASPGTCPASSGDRATLQSVPGRCVATGARPRARRRLAAVGYKLVVSVCPRTVSDCMRDPLPVNGTHPHRVKAEVEGVEMRGACAWPTVERASRSDSIEVHFVQLQRIDGLMPESRGDERAGSTAVLLVETEVRRRPTDGRTDGRTPQAGHQLTRASSEGARRRGRSGRAPRCRGRTIAATDAATMG